MSGSGRVVAPTTEALPSGWRSLDVGEALNICNNLRKPISVEEREVIPGPYPYHGPTKIQGWINEYQQDGTFALIGEDGDHFLKYATMPMTRLIHGKATVNNHAHVLTSTEVCSAEWFYYYFMHRNLSDVLTRQGAGRYKLNKSTLEKLNILVPPLVEQAKITKVLSAWGRAIDVLNQLSANAEANKKALMQQLLTGKRRFKKFVSCNASVMTPLGELPKDWEVVRIGDVAREVTERCAADMALPVLSCSKHDGFVDSMEYFKKKVYSDDLSNYKVVTRGDFGFPSNHIEEGSIGYQDVCDCGLVSPIYTVFRASDKIVDGYLYRLLKTEHYRQVFAASTNASVDRRGSLRWGQFKNIWIPLPSVEEQRGISDTIDVAQNEIDNLVSQLDALRKQKRALMQQLLTGKRRVKLDEAA